MSTEAGMESGTAEPAGPSHAGQPTVDVEPNMIFPIMDPAERQRYVESFKFPHCDNVSKYVKISKIGQGTFGEVFKARTKIGARIVALKKILMDNQKEGFPTTALRELQILKLLKHVNIVNMIEICYTPAGGTCIFYLVFEFCDHDLAGLLANKAFKFSLAHIKNVMKQLLNGIFYIHVSKILHRDLKPANVLITRDGVLKLADFGLARAFSINRKDTTRYTNLVVSLWYRPPELLLGERNYGPAVDMWSAGCIMAQMWTRTPILQGLSEQEQLLYITQLCGSITPEVMPGVERLELYNKMVPAQTYKRRVRERMSLHVGDSYACDLVDQLLMLDPAKRIDANMALDHDFFWKDPMPVELKSLIQPHRYSMFELEGPTRRVATRPVLVPRRRPRAEPEEGLRDIVF